MKYKGMKLTALFLLMPLIFSNAYARMGNNPLGGTTYVEVVAESDGTSELSGFHFISYLKSDASQWTAYYGGGPVYVSLPDENDTFVAIHAITGGDFKLTGSLGINLEFGFDIGEQFIINDETGLPSANAETPNRIDYSFAGGLVIDLHKSIYLKTYVRYHAFDGVFLPPTEVTMFGVRAGIKF